MTDKECEDLAWRAWIEGADTVPPECEGRYRFVARPLTDAERAYIEPMLASLRMRWSSGDPLLTYAAGGRKQPNPPPPPGSKPPPPPPPPRPHADTEKP